MLESCVMKASVTCQRPAGLGSSALPVPFPAAPRSQGGVRIPSTQKGGAARGSGISGRLRPLNAYVAEQAEHGRRGERFYVLSLLAESVELNVRLACCRLLPWLDWLAGAVLTAWCLLQALVQRFETLAGRSAMVWPARCSHGASLQMHFYCESKSCQSFCDSSKSNFQALKVCWCRRADRVHCGLDCGAGSAAPGPVWCMGTL